LALKVMHLLAFCHHRRDQHCLDLIKSMSRRAETGS